MLVFNSRSDFEARFPNVKFVGGIDGLKENTKIANVTMIAHTQTKDLPEHIAPPNDELLREIFNNPNTIIVRTTDGTIPSAPGYITFPVVIGNAEGNLTNKSLFTALIRKGTYTPNPSPTSSPNQSPVVTYRKTPASSISSMASVANCILNVEGIDKAKLLLALYDNANCQGPEHTKHADRTQRGLALLEGSTMESGIFSRAEECIKSNKTIFDVVDLGRGERLLAVDMSTAEVDFSKYEAQHGIGKVAELIEDLRRKPKAKSCVIC